MPNFTQKHYLTLTKAERPLTARHADGHQDVQFYIARGGVEILLNNLTWPELGALGQAVHAARVALRQKDGEFAETDIRETPVIADPDEAARRRSAAVRKLLEAKA